jgi:hypothetical protein
MAAADPEIAVIQLPLWSSPTAKRALRVQGRSRGKSLRDPKCELLRIGHEESRKGCAGAPSDSTHATSELIADATAEGGHAPAALLVKGLLANRG